MARIVNFPRSSRLRKTTAQTHPQDQDFRPSRMHRQPYQRAQHHPYKTPMFGRPYVSPFRNQTPPLNTFLNPNPSPGRDYRPLFGDHTKAKDRNSLEGLPSLNTLYKNPVFVRKPEFPPPSPKFWKQQPHAPFPFQRPASPEKQSPNRDDQDPASPRPAVPDAAPGVGPVRYKVGARGVHKARRSPEDRAHARARKELDKLGQKVHETMRQGPVTAEDEIFLQQMKALRVDQVYRHELSKHRDAMERAAGQDEERVIQLSLRDKKAKKIKQAVAAENERRKEEARRREEEERLAEERRREEETRLAEERQRRRLAEAKRREEEMERERQIFERERQEFERREQERKARDEQLRQEALLREEIRKAREAARQEAVNQGLLQQFALYEGKWAELKADAALHSIHAAQLPWPVIVSDNGFIGDITHTRIQEFMFHPLRTGLDGKSRRDILKMEILRYHPDKFNARVLDKLLESERGLAGEVAGNVARILTQMMAEETSTDKQ